MTLEEIQSEIEANVSGCRLEIIPNNSPSGQHSLLLDAALAVDVARFLRDAASLRLDFCSNVTGVDWPGKAVSEKITVKKIVDGAEQQVEEARTTQSPGYLEAVYHLYSMEKKQGPVILRLRTENRTDRVHLPSLTP
ncbi:MAG TPA: NADH-quinone oxidoreductase subunit C, partial [Acidobacteriaceae bacterium]|nr:NADH-quinone oxidoreductase subunit C [Acidobacteriaceae bacterium]